MAFECHNTFAPARSDGRNLVVVHRYSMSDRHAPLKSTGVVGNPEFIYSSAENIYLADTLWYDGGYFTPAFAETRFHKLEAFAEGDGASAYLATGTFPGQLHNQFSMDEEDGRLRAVLTTNDSLSGSSDRNRTSLLVIEEDGVSLVEAGRVDDIGKGEFVQAVRFLGDFAYVVTYPLEGDDLSVPPSWRIPPPPVGGIYDPLYVIDLSEPTKPRIRGELEVEGYSTYIHPLGDDHLLTIGVDSDENGLVLGMALSVFDVADPDEPKLAHRHAFGDGLSFSEALQDHHAFTFFASRKALAIPIQLIDESGWVTSTGLEVFRIDAAEGISPMGVVEQLSLFDREELVGWTAGCAVVRRSVMIAEGGQAYVYALSTGGRDGRLPRGRRPRRHGGPAVGERGQSMSLGHAPLTLATPRAGSLGVIALVLCLAPGARGQTLVPSFDAERAFERCEERLIAHDPGAAACFEAIAATKEASPEDAAVATELAHAARALEAPPLADEPAGPEVSVSKLVETGAPELVLSGAAYGGVAGFLTAASALSATRISQVDSLPWLIGTPALGILAGGAAAATAAYSLELDAGDAALVSSSLWVGTGWGVGLQLALFDQADDVGHVPFRFATVLGTGLGLGVIGAASAWAFDIDPGDVGLSNSAAIWGAVLSGLAYATPGTSGLITLEPGHPAATLPGVVSVMLTASVLPWALVLSLHPFLDVPRAATWLVEGGGLAGIFVGFALTSLLSNTGLPTAAVPATVTVTTAIGVATGTALTFVFADAAAALDLADLTGRFFSVAPALLPPAPGRVELAPSVLATLRF